MSMTYIDRDDIPEEEIEAIFDQLTLVFRGQDIGTCMGAMCHKLATICAAYTTTDEEAKAFMDVFVGDIMNRIPLYRGQAIGDVMGRA